MLYRCTVLALSCTCWFHKYVETNIKRTSDKQAMRGQVDHMQILLIDKSGLQIGLLKVYMLNYIFSVFSDCILILSTCNAMEVVSFAIDV